MGGCLCCKWNVGEDAQSDPPLPPASQAEERASALAVREVARRSTRLQWQACVTLMVFVLVSIVLVLSLGALVTHFTTRIGHDDTNIRTARRVVDGALNLRIGLADAEIVQRAYLLTADPKYYGFDYKTMWNLYLELRDHIRSVPEAVPDDFKTMPLELSEALDELKRGEELRALSVRQGSPGVDSAYAEPPTAHEKQEIDAIRQAAEEAQNPSPTNASVVPPPPAVPVNFTTVLDRRRPTRLGAKSRSILHAAVAVAVANETTPRRRADPINPALEAAIRAAGPNATVSWHALAVSRPLRDHVRRSWFELQGLWSDLQTIARKAHDTVNAKIASADRTLLVMYYVVWGGVGFVAVAMTVGATVFLAFNRRATSVRGEELRLLLDRAEEATRLKRRFLSSVSHELRTPMTGVASGIDLLRGTAMTDEQREIVALMKTSCNVMLRLVNDILLFAKIESGSFVLVPQPVDLHQLLLNVCEQYYLESRPKRLVFSGERAFNLPQLVFIDGHRFEQVLCDLLSNACTFTPTGGAVRLSVACPPQTDSGTAVIVHVSVSDTGIGIRREDQSLLFRPFAPLLPVTGYSSGMQCGTGLGLTIAQKLIRLMGGEITVQSEVGRGSEFSFSIPMQLMVQQPSDSQPAAVTPPPGPGAQPPRASGFTMRLTGAPQGPSLGGASRNGSKTASAAPTEHRQSPQQAQAAATPIAVEAAPAERVSPITRSRRRSRSESANVHPSIHHRSALQGLRPPPLSDVSLCIDDSPERPVVHASMREYPQRRRGRSPPECGPTLTRGLAMPRAVSATPTLASRTLTQRAMSERFMRKSSRRSAGAGHSGRSSGGSGSGNSSAGLVLAPISTGAVVGAGPRVSSIPPWSVGPRTVVTTSLDTPPFHSQMQMQTTSVQCQPSSTEDSPRSLHSQPQQSQPKHAPAPLLLHAAGKCVTASSPRPEHKSDTAAADPPLRLLCPLSLSADTVKDQSVGCTPSPLTLAPRERATSDTAKGPAPLAFPQRPCVDSLLPACAMRFAGDPSSSGHCAATRDAVASGCPRSRGGSGMTTEMVPISNGASPLPRKAAADAPAHFKLSPAPVCRTVPPCHTGEPETTRCEPALPHILAAVDQAVATAVADGAAGNSGSQCMQSSDPQLLSDRKSVLGVSDGLTESNPRDPHSSVKRSASASASQKYEPQTSSTIHKPGISLQVMVVEDSEVVAKLMCRMVARLGHSCQTAANGREALELTTLHPFGYDVLFMDLQMPVMDGLTATKRIRERERQLLLEAVLANGRCDGTDDTDDTRDGRDAVNPKLRALLSRQSGAAAAAAKLSAAAAAGLLRDPQDEEAADSPSVLSVQQHTAGKPGSRIPGVLIRTNEPHATATSKLDASDANADRNTATAGDGGGGGGGGSDGDGSGAGDTTAAAARPPESSPPSSADNSPSPPMQLREVRWSRFVPHPAVTNQQTVRLPAPTAVAPEPHRMTIIACTAGADEETQSQAMRAGCDGVLLKPVSLKQLQFTLDQIVTAAMAAYNARGVRPPSPGRATARNSPHATARSLVTATAHGFALPRSPLHSPLRKAPASAFAMTMQSPLQPLWAPATNHNNPFSAASLVTAPTPPAAAATATPAAAAAAPP